jgi:hypothetical protein
MRKFDHTIVFQEKTQIFSHKLSKIAEDFDKKTSTIIFVEQNSTIECTHQHPTPKMKVEQ